MMLVIRIAGQVNIEEGEKEALYRLRLRRKYAAVLLEPTKENLSLLKKIRNRVAYGTINRETLIELISKRGQPVIKTKKIDAEKIAQELETSRFVRNVNKTVSNLDGAQEPLVLDKKSLSSLGLKPFFRLHPPRGGIDSKVHFGKRKGVLGDNKEKINDLLRRML